MKTIVLDILAKRRTSAGDITRQMMGEGLVPNTPESYSLVKATLAALLADGLVAKHGNGKSVHWALVKS